MKKKDNKYSAVESYLYSVPKLKAEISNLKIDLEETKKIMAIRGVSGNVAAGSSTYAFNSTVENEVIDRDENLDERIKSVMYKIESRENKLNRIMNNLETLTESERLLIELRYFKRYSVVRVCDVLEITKDTFNNRRNKILIKHLIPLFFIQD